MSLILKHQTARLRQLYCNDTYYLCLFIPSSKPQQIIANDFIMKQINSMNINSQQNDANISTQNNYKQKSTIILKYIQNELELLMTRKEELSDNGLIIFCGLNIECNKTEIICKKIQPLNYILSFDYICSKNFIIK
eukprot:6119_1